MKTKLIVTLFIFTISIFFFSSSRRLYAQDAVMCKMFFCNCCHNYNTAIYNVYDMNTDTLIGGFYFDSTGCGLNHPINVVTGQVCFVETSCSNHSLATLVYFTP